MGADGAWIRPALAPVRQLLMSRLRCDVPEKKEVKMAASGRGQESAAGATFCYEMVFLTAHNTDSTLSPSCSPQSSSCSSCKHNKYVASALFFLQAAPSGSTCGDPPVADLRSGSSHANVTWASCSYVKKKRENVQWESHIGSLAATGHVHITLNLMELSVSHMQHTAGGPSSSCTTTSTYFSAELCNKMSPGAMGRQWR